MSLRLLQFSNWSPGAMYTHPEAYHPPTASISAGRVLERFTCPLPTPNLRGISVPAGRINAPQAGVYWPQPLRCGQEQKAAASPHLGGMRSAQLRHCGLWPKIMHFCVSAQDKPPVSSPRRASAFMKSAWPWGGPGFSTDEPFSCPRVHSFWLS